MAEDLHPILVVKNPRRKTTTIRLAALALLVAATAYPAVADAAFRYFLSDFAGAVRLTQPRLRADRHHDEVYLTHANLIRVFGSSGMEVYRFDAAPELGLVTDLAVTVDGDLIVLSRGLTATPEAGTTFVTRCDYRGTPIERLDRSDWPQALPGVEFDRMVLRGGRLYLVSLSELFLVETGLDGRFLRARDLAGILGIDEKDRESRTVQIGGFDVDRDGNLLLTIPTRFQAFIVPPEGVPRMFGRPGSAPGMFGKASGIVAADDGRVLVADRLRCVVMVFGPDLQFVEEFGYFGPRPENLEGPADLAIGNGDVLYVAQRADRGVSVFSVAAE